MIGHTLGGKYRVVRRIGEGGMGCLYEGEQPLGSAKRKVAIKTLHPHLSHDAQIKARFEREVATIAQLEHPNTIQVYDFGCTADGILYIVMELLHGRTLADLVGQEGALAPDRALHILQQVCGSLEEAHARGIIHRDLKPDNVMLVDRAGSKDFVKVLDFGIAKRSSKEDESERRLTQQGTVLGTPPYMSPEQFTAQSIDARSDIYSLGVLAYELVTAKLPFAAQTPWEWAMQHAMHPPQPIESLAEGRTVPEAMRAAIERALAKSPDQRFPTVKDFCDALSGRGIPAATQIGSPLGVFFPPPVGIPDSLPRASAARRGSRTMLVLAAGVIALGSIIAIGSAVHGSGRRGVRLDTEELSPPATTLAVEPAAAALAKESEENDSVPELKVGGGIAQGRRSAPHVPQSRSPASSSASPLASPPAASTLPTVSPSFPVPSLPSPAARRYDGHECQTARRLRSLGYTKEAEGYALACIAKGGDPEK
jgi:serine/threonine-protein kinase